MYRIDSVTPARRLLAVQCATGHGPVVEQLAYEQVVVSDSDIHRDWIVHASRCDRRVVRRVAAVFRGHFASGLETSVFVPCPADTWLLASDSVGTGPIGPRAWVAWPPGAWQAVKKLEAPRDGFGNRRYYVQWRGTVIGPGGYGHMGMSPFEFRVDTVFVVRPAQSSDCR